MVQSESERYCIVCGVDFTSASEYAVREAHRLAGHTTPSVLHFVHALGVARSEVDAADTDVAEGVAARLEAFVRRARRGTGWASVANDAQRIVCHARRQDIQTALVDVAREEGADLLVVGATERRGLSQLWHRSAVLALIRHAPAPVLVARDRRGDAAWPGAPTLQDGRGVVVTTAPGFSGHWTQTKAIDADSVSNLCRLYEARLHEARASEATSTSRVCKPGATEAPWYYATAG